MKTIFRQFLSIILVSLFITSFVYYIYPKFINNESIRSNISSSISTIPTPSSTLIPTEIPKPTPNIKNTIIPTIIRQNIVPTATNKPSDNEPWGVARQIDEHTWAMKTGEDPAMATPDEILKALNDYRHKHGAQTLFMDQKLSEYAQTRVDYFNSIKGLDGHKGFENFLDNEDGFKKLGFTWLGENASYGYKLNGVHLIEWVYAGDEPHDKNQLDNKWSNVGIGVKGTATCLIFATGRM